MTTDYASLPYRPCAGLMLVNGDGLVFVGKRIDNKEGDAWQMPQGGIDDGEQFLAAAMRELWEETGVTDALVTGVAGRLPWAQLVRRIEGVSGEVRFRWAVISLPRFLMPVPASNTRRHGSEVITSTQAVLPPTVENR